jgi:hypothetical protein
MKTPTPTILDSQALSFLQYENDTIDAREIKQVSNDKMDIYCSHIYG